MYKYKSMANLHLQWSHFLHTLVSDWHIVFFLVEELGTNIEHCNSGVHTFRRRVIFRYGCGMNVPSLVGLIVSAVCNVLCK